MGGSGEKAQVFSNFEICHNQFFLLENPTHWGFQTAVFPVFAKPVLDIFAVCSLVLRMNCPICNKNIYAQKIKITY